MAFFRPWEDKSDPASANGDSSEDRMDNFDRHGENIEPPAKKLRKHLCIHQQQMIIVIYNNVVLRFGKARAIEETSSLTEIPPSTINKIVRQGPSSRKRRIDRGKKKEIDASTAKFLRTIIYDSYSRREIPTVDTIIRDINARNIPIKMAASTIKYNIKKLGFKFGSIDKRASVMESRRIVEWRHTYLEKIQLYRREQKPIYYLDETWYDTHDTAKKGWTDKSKHCNVDVPYNKGTRLIILHCGSENGWVSNCLKIMGKNINDCKIDYHDNMNADVFEEWFQNSLIPQLEPGSVIVLDNAPYHSRLVEKVPNTSSCKDEIRNFLHKNDLYFEENYSKKQLLEVLSTKNFPKKYVVDEMANAANFIVLRLPPYFCIFNPIELIWGQLKKRIRRKNIFPTKDDHVVDLIKSEISAISGLDWKRKTEKIKAIEKDYCRLRTVHFDTGYRFIIDLEEDSSDSDDA